MSLHFEEETNFQKSEMTRQLINTSGSGLKESQLHKALKNFFLTFLCGTEDTHHDNFRILVVLIDIFLNFGLSQIVVYSFSFWHQTSPIALGKKANKDISKKCQTVQQNYRSKRSPLYPNNNSYQSNFSSAFAEELFELLFNSNCGPQLDCKIGLAICQNLLPVHAALCPG